MTFTPTAVVEETTRAPRRSAFVEPGVAAFRHLCPCESLPSKKKRVPVVFAGLAMLVASCVQPPPEAAFMEDLPPSQWDSAFAALPPPSQLIAFRYAIVGVHPSIHLESQLAREGREVLPFLLTEMEREDHSGYLVSLLSVVGAMRCEEGVELGEATFAVLRRAETRVRGSSRREFARWAVRRAIEGSCGDLPPGADLMRD